MVYGRRAFGRKKEILERCMSNTYTIYFISFLQPEGLERRVTHSLVLDPLGKQKLKWLGDYTVVPHDADQRGGGEIIATHQLLGESSGC